MNGLLKHALDLPDHARPRFKSVTQQHWVTFCMNGEANGVVIDKAGGGKTLGIIVPALHFGHLLTTLVISPRQPPCWTIS